MSTWIDAGPADLADGELRGLELQGRLVLLSRHGGAVHAMDDSCNHAGCLLSGGWIDLVKGAVVCPCHEFAFDLKTGINITEPRLCEDQPAYPVRIEAGRVFIQLEEGA